jgi:hypothetical protein
MVTGSIDPTSIPNTRSLGNLTLGQIQELLSPPGKPNFVAVGHMEFVDGEAGAFESETNDGNELFTDLILLNEDYTFTEPNGEIVTVYAGTVVGYKEECNNLFALTGVEYIPVTLGVVPQGYPAPHIFDGGEASRTETSSVAAGFNNRRPPDDPEETPEEKPPERRPPGTDTPVQQTPSPGGTPPPGTPSGTPPPRLVRPGNSTGVNVRPIPTSTGPVVPPTTVVPVVPSVPPTVVPVVPSIPTPPSIGPVVPSVPPTGGGLPITGGGLLTPTPPSTAPGGFLRGLFGS